MKSKVMIVLGLGMLLNATALFADTKQNLMPDLTHNRRGSSDFTYFWYSQAKDLAEGKFSWNENSLIEMKSDDLSRMQFGVSINPANLLKKVGKEKATFSFLFPVTGEITKLKTPLTLDSGVAIVVQMDQAGKDQSFMLTPNTTFDHVKNAINEKQKIGKVAKNITVNFSIDEDSKDLKFMLYLLNAAGSIVWEKPQIIMLDDNANVDFIFKTVDVAQKRLERRNWIAREYTKLGIPQAEDLYKPSKILTGNHPRFMLSTTSLSEIKKRYNSPEYKKYHDELIKYANLYKNPTYYKKGGHHYDLTYSIDPVATLVLAYKLEDDKVQKNEFYKGILGWIDNADINLRKMKTNLWPSAMLTSMSIMYDWTFDDLPIEYKNKLRNYIIDTARWQRDPKNADGWFWRSLHQWTANHKLMQFSSLAMASMALWGETEDLEADEPKKWLDEAMREFWMIEGIAPNSGAPMEGWMYRSLENAAYYNMAIISHDLTDCKFDFFHADSFKNRAKYQLNFLIPNQKGFFTFSDSYYRSWLYPSMGSYSRLQASYYQDGYSQKLADILENSERIADYPSYLWRSLFWYNPKLKAKAVEEQDLYFDDNEFGLYVARDNWSKDATALFFKGGALGGQKLDKFRQAGEWNNFSMHTSCGHWTPDNGTFQFVKGDNVIVAGVEYPGFKATMDYPVIIVNNHNQKDDRYQIGQTGAAKNWFYFKTYDKLGAQPTVKTWHKNGVHIYKIELGGMYNIGDNRVKNSSFHPKYTRYVVFFTDGAVGIADKFIMPVAREVRFRIPMTVSNLTKDSEKSYSFFANYIMTTPAPQSNGVNGKIYDVSPNSYESKILTHNPKTYGGITERKTFELMSNSENSTFGALINLNDKFDINNFKVYNDYIEVNIDNEILKFNF